MTDTPGNPSYSFRSRRMATVAAFTNIVNYVVKSITGFVKSKRALSKVTLAVSYAPAAAITQPSPTNCAVFSPISAAVLTPKPAAFSQFFQRFELFQLLSRNTANKVVAIDAVIKLAFF